jgi:hypothetical protein
MAELVGAGAAELSNRLEEVSEAKVFNTAEIQKAKDYRDAMDDLSDAWEDFVIQVGTEAAPAFGAAAKGLVIVAKAVETATGATENGYRRLSNGKLVFREQAKAQQELIDKTWEAQAAQDAGALSIGNYVNATQSAIAEDKRYAQSLEEVSTRGEIYGLVLGQVLPKQRNLAESLRETFSAADLSAAAADRLNAAWSRLLGNIDEEEALAGLEDQLRVTGEAALAAYAAASSGSADAAEKARAYEQAQRDLKRAVVDYGQATKDLPAEKFTKILALIDEGKLAEAEARLKILTRNRTMSVSIQTRGGIGYSEEGRRAAGGPVRAGGAYLVGERGPELMVPSTNGRIIPNHRLAAGGGVNIAAGGIVIQSVNPNYDGRALVESIRRYERMSGTGWRS